MTSLNTDGAFLESYIDPETGVLMTPEKRLMQDTTMALVSVYQEDVAATARLAISHSMENRDFLASKPMFMCAIMSYCAKNAEACGPTLCEIFDLLQLDAADHGTEVKSDEEALRAQAEAFEAIERQDIVQRVRLKIMENALKSSQLSSVRRPEAQGRLAAMQGRSTASGFSSASASDAHRGPGAVKWKGSPHPGVEEASGEEDGKVEEEEKETSQDEGVEEANEEKEAKDTGLSTVIDRFMVMAIARAHSTTSPTGPDFVPRPEPRDPFAGINCACSVCNVLATMHQQRPWKPQGPLARIFAQSLLKCMREHC